MNLADGKVTFAKRDRKFSTSKEPSAKSAHLLCFDHTRKLTVIYPCSEQSSKIHRQFREAHEGHRPHAGLDPSRASTGVVWT